VSPAAIELIRHTRQELGLGAARTRLWLQRVHGIRLAMGTIQRVFRDLGMARLRRTRKRQPRQMKLFEKAEPGESIQVDVKYVSIAGRWAFQYTALDDCTRFRVLRLYRRPPPPSESGRPGTTTSASPWRSRAAPRPKNSPRSTHRCGSPRRRMSTRGRHQKPSVNLDETQQNQLIRKTSPPTTRH